MSKKIEEYDLENLEIFRQEAQNLKKKFVPQIESASYEHDIEPCCKKIKKIFKNLFKKNADDIVTLEIFAFLSYDEKEEKFNVYLGSKKHDIYYKTYEYELKVNRNYLLVILAKTLEKEGKLSQLANKKNYLFDEKESLKSLIYIREANDDGKGYISISNIVCSSQNNQIALYTILEIIANTPFQDIYISKSKFINNIYCEFRELLNINVYLQNNDIEDAIFTGFKNNSVFLNNNIIKNLEILGVDGFFNYRNIATNISLFDNKIDNITISDGLFKNIAIHKNKIIQKIEIFNSIGNIINISNSANLKLTICNIILNTLKIQQCSFNEGSNIGYIYSAEEKISKKIVDILKKHQKLEIKEISNNAINNEIPTKEVIKVIEVINKISESDIPLIFNPFFHFETRGIFNDLKISHKISLKLYDDELLYYIKDKVQLEAIQKDFDIILKIIQKKHPNFKQCITIKNENTTQYTGIKFLEGHLLLQDFLEDLPIVYTVDHSLRPSSLIDYFKYRKFLYNLVEEDKFTNKNIFFNRCNFDNLKLSYISFRKGDILKLKGCELINFVSFSVKLPKNIFFSDQEDFAKEQEGYRQLKVAMTTQHSTAERLEFYGKELEAYKKVLKSQKSKFQDIFILNISKWTNNHNQSWIQPILWMLILNIYYILYEYNKEVKSCIDNLCVFSSYFKILAKSMFFPLDYKDDIDDIKYHLIIVGMYKIIYGILIYKTIQSFRRFNLK